MFIRITILEFDPTNANLVERYWREKSHPSALSQKGNLRAEAFRVVGSPGKVIMVGEWESQELADRYLYSPEHDALNAGLAPCLKGNLVRYLGNSVD
jgi:quinol monooxygenase YgiN